MVIYMKLKNSILKIKNLIFFFVLITLGTFSFVGLSYVFGVSKYFSEYALNSIDGRLVYVGIDDVKNAISLKKSLEDNLHIINVYESTEINNYGIVKEFTNNLYDGDIEISPIKNVNFNIISGKSSVDTDGMICPSNFFPSNYTLNDSFDMKKNFNLDKYIGRYLNIKYFNEFDVKVKLVGTFDRTQYFTRPNTCYINYKTYYDIMKNRSISVSSNDADSHFVILLDNIDNISILENFSNISFYQPVTKLKTSILEEAIYVVALIMSVILVVSCVLCYLFTNRTIMNNYKNIGILKIVGYPNKTIKKQIYLLNLILSILAYLISIAISIAIESNLAQLLLSKNADLCLITFKNSWIGYFISFMLVVIFTMAFTGISLKKIDNFDIKELVNV